MIPLFKTQQDIDNLKDRITRLVEEDINRCVLGEAKYASSWRKRGGTGAFENVFRKVDRIAAAGERCGNDIFKCVLQNPASDGTIGGKDSMLDDLRDLRIYLLLIEDYINLFEQLVD